MHKATRMTIRFEHPTHSQMFFFRLIFALAAYLAATTADITY
jgi:hypothetical protein